LFFRCSQSLVTPYIISLMNHSNSSKLTDNCGDTWSSNTSKLGFVVFFFVMSRLLLHLPHKGSLHTPTSLKLCNYCTKSLKLTYSSSTVHSHPYPSCQTRNPADEVGLQSTLPPGWTSEPPCPIGNDNPDITDQEWELRTGKVNVTVSTQESLILRAVATRFIIVFVLTHRARNLRSHTNSSHFLLHGPRYRQHRHTNHVHH
jgi:hypothetical protein